MLRRVRKLRHCCPLAKPLIIDGGAGVISVGYSGSDADRDPDDIEGGRRIIDAGSSIEELGFKVTYSCFPVETSQSAQLGVEPSAEFPPLRWKVIPPGLSQ